MRRDIYDMFVAYKAEFQYKWNQIISAGYGIFLLSELSYLERANRAYVERTSCDESVIGPISNRWFVLKSCRLAAGRGKGQAAAYPST